MIKGMVIDSLMIVTSTKSVFSHTNHEIAIKL